jgi:glycosyltransferase involved in cell wall biosynthesis
MPGGGTSLAITTHSPTAHLLDVTRLLSRPGRRPTGVDRVELAYLKALLSGDIPVWGLARVAPGYALLDRPGLTAFLDRVEGRTPYGRTHPFWMAARRLTPLQRRAQSDLWRLSQHRSFRRGLPRLLAHLPTGVQYFNVGHSNLTWRNLSALRALPDARISVMIHDTIPLDFPEYQRPESVARFAGLLRRTGEYADQILCNSQVTADDVTRHLGPDTPPCLVAHLGVEMPVAGHEKLPETLPQDRPCFVALGTIEPRKNHALLMDAWDILAKSGGPMPVLAICGARGWKNHDLFERLDQSPLKNRDIFEFNTLSDAEISALLTHSRALLFPSHAEGYGLPPVEAAMLGTPVIAAPLPSLREIMGELPVYLEVGDVYPWVKAIKSFMDVGQSGTAGKGAFQPPTWEDHFKTVLNTA